MAEDREEEREGGRGFTVSDRRRFSPETGDARPDGESRREGGKKQEKLEEEEAQGEPAAGAQAPEESPKPGSRPAGTGRAAPLPEITLSTFIVSMSTQVLMLMGESPDPTGRKLERDLNGAKQVIDILGMLKVKTKGNLDKSEEVLFDNVLYDLRMRYVELTKADTQN